VALPVCAGADAGQPTREASAWLSARGVDLAAVRAAAPAARAGAVTPLPLPGGGQALLVGVGDASTDDLRRAAAAAARSAREKSELTLALEASADQLRVLGESALLAAYRFSRATDTTDGLQRIEVVTPAPQAAAALRRAAVTARASWIARDLANTPSGEKSPAWLAERAHAAVSSAAVTVEVRDERALLEEGFGGILGVGAGSVRPPRLIELRYRPRGARRHLVLVGKGITFDSGGLSIKPADAMVPMKTDMSGGAAVIAVMSALADLDVGVSVTGLVPAAENMPSGSAMRPGDVLRHFDGRTVEVLNTDAEGRLVLADALGYAVRRLSPTAIVDVATLTGAASRGLGRIHAALFSGDDALAAGLLSAAADAHEQLWRLPLVEDYRAALESPVADLRNVADPTFHYSGGAIAAALFLREFTGGVPWAHLDIAGPARSDKDRDEITRGGTGYGVRLLLRWLESQPAR
jgi:leucyl aminopeptidase